jgi:hypothetical protein
MKILCIHGVGHQEVNLDWEDAWKNAIAKGLIDTHPGLDAESLEVSFTNYDDFFADPVNQLTPLDIARAVTLLGGGVLHRAFSLPNIVDGARWTAGMVIVWVENDDVRQQARDQFLNDVETIQPDLICAHSLGTLISYDAFRRNANLLTNRTYLTFGCQLGNFFVRGQFGGRVEPFTEARFWYDLYNSHDHVFTAPLDFGAFQTASNFLQVHTDFGSDWPWPLNHDAVSPDPVNAPEKGYLTNPETVTQVFAQIPIAAASLATGVEVGAAMPSRAVVVPGSPRVKEFTAAVVQSPDAPTRRALLVGINNYPDPANRLQGCLNDVFLMSSVLQECGFRAEDIRVVFDDRATAAGILERLHWLLDGTASHDQRFFFYSGHGAQLPAYGVNGRIQRIDACLVPYDFAWTSETAITDDRLVNLYSQLPYDAHFMMVLDSCYSGGMTRGSLRVRGLEPPDDIRHQMLRWNAKDQMWVSRDLPPADADRSEKRRGFVETSVSMHALGRAVSLRTQSQERYKAIRAALKHDGPYMPMVYESCGEKEYATEYQHGVTSYGAFTYAMAAILRRHKGATQSLTFRQLERETADVLDKLHYQQHPVLSGPKDLLDLTIPWDGLGGNDEKK